jgi:hypothetical protein
VGSRPDDFLYPVNNKSNRTPEQEAYRLSRLREALKGKPATEQQREARAEGLRKAWAEGRIKPSSTPESVAKTAAKLRGRKRPAHVIEAARAANLGRKKSPEHIEKMRARMLEIVNQPGYVPPSRRPGVSEKISAAKKGLKISEEQRRRHSEVMRGYKWSDDVVESRAKSMRGRPQTAEITKKGPTNKASIEGALRDPCGRIWWFRNLSHFVRTHPELFDQKDLIEKRRNHNKSAVTCNAIKRLLALFGRGKKVPGTWKGWTVGSSTVERITGHSDLLGRDQVNVTPATEKE